MKVDLFNYFPIPPGGLREDCIVNGDMDLTAGFRFRLPQVFSMSDGEYTSLHNSLTQLIKRQSVGTVIHVQDFRYVVPFDRKYKGESIVQKENFASFQERPVLRGYTNLYISLSNRKLRKINAMDSRFLRGLKYVTASPLSDVGRVISEYKKNVKPFENNLNVIDRIKADRMNTEELRCAIGNYFGLRYANPLSIEEAKNFRIPDYEITDGYLRIGNQFVAVVSITQEGPRLTSNGNSSHLPREVSGVLTPQSTKLPTSMVYPLTIGLPFNHIYNVSIEVLDNPSAKNSLGGIEAFGTNILSGFLDEAKHKRDETELFIDTITKHNYQACRTTVNVIVNDSSLESLATKVSYVEQQFSNMNDSKVFIENVEAANLFFCSSPGYARANHRTFLQTVDMGVSYIPKESLYGNDPEGLIFTSPYGEPVTLNFLNPPELDNRNGVLFGPSGTGKSVLLNYLSDQFLAAGCSVFTVDVGSTEGGSSFHRNCVVNKGMYLDSRDAKNFTFNPFLCKVDGQGKYLFEPEDEDALVKNYQVNLVYSNIAAVLKVKQEEQVKRILKKSIRAFYQAVNDRNIFPDLTEYFNFTKHYESEILEKEYRGYIDFNKIRLLLEPFAIGEYKSILNGKRNDSEMNNRYVVTELKSVIKDDDLRDVVFLNTLNNITKIVEQKNFNYFFAILDEVVDYLQGDFGDSIGGFFRKIRKDGGGVIVATQGIDYLDKIDPMVKASILSNCDIKLLTNHNKYKNLYPSLRRDLSLTDVDFGLMNSLEKDSNSREVFMKFGNKPGKYRVELSPYAFGLYNTDEKAMKKIYGYEKEYGSMNAAIRQFIEDKNQTK